MIIAGRRERRQAEAFAAAVAVESERDCENDVVALVGLAETLRETGAETPRPEFVRHLREELMREARSGPTTPTVAQDVTPAKPAGLTAHGFGLRRRFGAVAATVVATGASMAVVTESVQALPGEALYPVKQSIEYLTIARAQDPAAKRSTHLEVAATRLDEITSMASGDAGVREAAATRTTLDDFTVHVQQADDSLSASRAGDGDPPAIDEVTAFTHSSCATLEALADDLPASASASFAAAMQVLHDLGASAEQLGNGCQVPSSTSPAGPLTSPLRQRTGAGDLSEPKQPAEDATDSAPPESSTSKDGPEEPEADPPVPGTTPNDPPVPGTTPNDPPVPGATPNDPPVPGTTPNDPPSKRPEPRLPDDSGAGGKVTDLVEGVVDRPLVSGLRNLEKELGRHAPE